MSRSALSFAGSIPLWAVGPSALPCAGGFPPQRPPPFARPSSTLGTCDASDLRIQSRESSPYPATVNCSSLSPRRQESRRRTKNAGATAIVENWKTYASDFAVDRQEHFSLALVVMSIGTFGKLWPN